MRFLLIADLQALFCVDAVRRHALMPKAANLLPPPLIWRPSREVPVEWGFNAPQPLAVFDGGLRVFGGLR